MIPAISSATDEGIKSSVPNIIKAAATSPLGIFALMIICLGVLGFAFFTKANQYIKLLIFLLFFGGVVAFGFSIKNETSAKKTAISGGSPSATVSAARSATITYTTTAPQWEPANWVSQQITTDNRGGMRAEGRSPTSPDGKWWASEKTATLQVAATGTKQRLINARFVFISGAGAFTEAFGPFYNQNATSVTATVKGWSGPATYELKAQIEEQRNVPKDNTTSLVIDKNPFTISVPHTASNARLTIVFDSQLLSVNLGETKEPLTLVKREANESLTEYTYNIND